MIGDTIRCADPEPSMQTRRATSAQALETPPILGQGPGMDWWAVIVALLMLVVFGGVAWGIRRFAGPVRIGGAQHIHIVGARRLDLNTTLYLVEVEGRRLLVGCGQLRSPHRVHSALFLRPRARYPSRR